jgi:hypothetical protein
MIIIILLIAAPTLQIIASILRITGHIGVPIGGIMFLAFFIGVVFSFVAMNTVELPSSPTGVRCGMPQFAVLCGSFFLQVITAPLIAVISYIVYRFKKQNENRLETS